MATVPARGLNPAGAMGADFGGEELSAHRSAVRIGGVSLAINGEAGDVALHPGLDNFKISANACDIEILVQWCEVMPAPPGRKIFHSGGVWTLYENDFYYVFDCETLPLGDEPYKRLFVNKNFSNGELLLNRKTVWPSKQTCPLEYPLDELLVTNWLSLRGAVEVHGCGLLDHETGGHLFVGNSGAGKSTTTELWRSHRKAGVLSDDRVILRAQGPDIWMHGTPWHGEVALASPECAKISRIFVLEHGAENEIEPLPPARAVGELFARCFPPFYSRQGLESVLAFLQHIALSVPCYLFRFVPDESAVEKVLNFQG